MFKNLCLSATFAALSFASLAASTDKIAAIQSNIAHIEQAKTDSLFELKTSIEIANQALQHFQSKLGDNFESSRNHVLSLLNTLMESEEFAFTLNDVTDRYVDYVVNQNMNFNDIVIDASDYPLEGRIEAIFTAASPALDAQTYQMFDVFYVTIAIMRSAELFCAKLDLKKDALLAEIATLEATN